MMRFKRPARGVFGRALFFIGIPFFACDKNGKRLLQDDGEDKVVFYFFYYFIGFFSTYYATTLIAIALLSFGIKVPFFIYCIPFSLFWVGLVLTVGYIIVSLLTWFLKQAIKIILEG